MTDLSIIRLHPDGANGQTLKPCSLVPEADVIDGKPIELGADILVAGDGAFTVGIWQSEPYAERFDNYPGTEFCHVLQGRVSLTDEKGNTQTFEAGDSYIVPKGFRGIFRVEMTFRKYYCFSPA